MRKIELSYQLCPERERAALIRNPLMEWLLAVRSSGSISGAARQLGLSYRHVWGELKRWEQLLAQPLIVWEKGQPARLTEFADKLLWAERQAQARLAPQISALQAELEKTFAMAFDPASHVLTVYASHDDALVRLREHAASQGLHLDMRFCGSVDAIRALNEGRCLLAGFHAQPFANADSRTARTYRPLLKPGLHKIIGFARRSQGLMVAPGNPLQLHDLADVARTRARFVNRALGTGTRLLLEELLAQSQVPASDLAGFEREESSHAAVAQAVASGAADAGLGTEYAARSHGLDYVPLTDERYLLVCLKSALDLPEVQSLLGLLRSERWQQRLQALAGYHPDHPGEVAAMKRLLPWWR